MQHLLDDPNARIQLVAVRALLADDPADTQAVTVLGDALASPTLGLRKAALGVIESLGANTEGFREMLKQRAAVEEDEEVRASLHALVARLERQAADARGPPPDLTAATEAKVCG